MNKRWDNSLFSENAPKCQGLPYNPLLLHQLKRKQLSTFQKRWLWEEAIPTVFSVLGEVNMVNSFANLRSGWTVFHDDYLNPLEIV